MNELRMPPFVAKTHRICAFCGKRGGGVWAFTLAIQQLGFKGSHEGGNSYAHGNCIVRERKKQMAKRNP